jgi:acyl dehydratase
VQSAHAEGVDVKCLEDFRVGQKWSTGAITLTESHVVTFAGLSGDFFPLHTDAVYAAQTEFGERLVHGPLVYACAVGLVSQSQVFGGAVVAFLGATDLRHRAPCFIGATIRVAVTVTDIRPSKNPERGVCSLLYEVSDDKESLLMTADMQFLMVTACKAGGDRAAASKAGHDR